MNVWALHNDPDEYENPSTFDPTRFLRNRFGTKLNYGDKESYNNDDNNNNKNNNKNGHPGLSGHGKTQGFRRDTWAFGAGRRACPGRPPRVRLVRVPAG